MSVRQSGAEALLAETGNRVRDAYGWAIGSERGSLVTPALLLDLPAARRNIDKMAAAMRTLPADLRPHFKGHKSPDLARLQRDAGMIGVSTATAWEAIVLVAAGFDHVFVVNEVVDRAMINALARAALSADLMVAADSPDNVNELARAARTAGSELGLLVDVDTGIDRCGVDSAEEAVALARYIVDQPGLRFHGVTGYEGHCSRMVDRDLRREAHVAAMALLLQTADAIEAHGIACPIRSAGGTVTWEWTASTPGITEIQAGSYVFMDSFHGRKIGDFESSLTVLASVLSVRPDRVIVNSGNKTIAMGELATIRGYTYEPVHFSEEHGMFETLGRSPLRVGEKVEVVPGYAPGTVNWFDAYHVMENDRVVDIWPVIPRGPGHHGLVRAAGTTG